MDLPDPLIEQLHAAELETLGAVRAFPGYNVMGLAKASLEANVRYLAHSLGPEGIRVNNLVPGRIDTQRVRALDEASADRQGVSVEAERAAQFARIPLGGYGDTADMGSAAAFLLSDAARYITGSTLVVDGGLTL